MRHARGYARFRQFYDIEMTHRALNRVYLELGSNVQASPEIEQPCNRINQAR